MNVVELRIGNYIQHIEDKTMSSIDMFYGSEIYIDEWGCGTTELKECEPIPLTEEWLLKFGFKKYGKTELFKKNSFTLKFWDNKLYWNDYRWSSNELKHVHQLQNLYFAITREELEYKD
jgi:hypothetical protein